MGELTTTFEALPAPQKEAQRASLIDCFLKLGKPDSALAQFDKNSGSKADARLTALEARAWLQKGDLDKAEKLAVQATQTKDDNQDNMSEAYLELARVQLAKNNTKAAEESVRKAIDFNGKSFAAFELLGRTALKNGQSDHALESGKSALEINPYFAGAYMLNGDASLALGKLQDAQANYKHAVELYPALIDAHRSLRDVYKKLAQKDEAQKEEDIITQMEKRS
jgi:tetratricopeptide (TPR) repeat protein